MAKKRRITRRRVRGGFNYSSVTKRTFQLTDIDAQERVDFHCAGERLIANQDNARSLLFSLLPQARRLFSRKKANDGWGARLGLKWLTQERKWVTKSIFYHHYRDLESAIEGLLLNPELSNLVSGDPDDPENQRAIASKTKRIEFASFDKYVTRKDKPGYGRRGRNTAKGKRRGKKKKASVSKAAPKRGKKKTPRRVRR